jgi:signal transduction histidine kinase/DNA-binding NarL/FixJ family response regulator
MERFIEKKKEEGETINTEAFLNILMVEDNPGDVVIVKEYLKGTGTRFNLTHAKNLKETFALCVEQEFDVILLDLGLQESTSLETLKMIKVFNIKSPIVVMTGLDDEDIALSSLREGAQDYLVKNRLTPESILKSIKYGIERKKIQDLLKKNTHRFSILSSAIARLSQCENIISSFSTTCENIHSLLENANAISLELDDSHPVLISCSEWLSNWYDEIKSYTGIDLKNNELPFNRDKKELLELFSDGKLHEAEEGLFEIFNGKVEKSKCEDLERIIGIRKIYAFGFIKAKNFYGIGIIFSPVIIEIEDIRIIETIIRQATLCIHRRSIEKELRLSEFRLRKLSKELEAKVVERTRDLEVANKNLHLELTERIKAENALKKNELQLKELNATKDKFFSIVAHDLKNPFTSLIGASELLYENISNMNNKEIHKLALILNDSSKSGYAILENLLDWSRSQTGMLKYNPENLLLNKLIEENIANLHLFASNKEIFFKYKALVETSIFSDKGMINTILRNLLSNAIKFSHRGSNVVITTNIRKDEIIVSVKDTGIGISEEKIENLFKLDTKHTSIGTEKEQGTGLGLKLSKELVEKEGGRIWVESAVNKGSTFYFSIPLRKPQFN